MLQGCLGPPATCRRLLLMLLPEATTAYILESVLLQAGQRGIGRQHSALARALESRPVEQHLVSQSSQQSSRGHTGIFRKKSSA